MRILLILLAVTSCAFGQAAPQAFDAVLSRRTDANDANYTRFRPTSSTYFVSVAFDPSSREPVTFAWDSGEFTVDISGGGTNGTTTPGSMSLSDGFYDWLEATYEPLATTGTSGQYWRGDKTWQAFPSIPSNTNQLTNGAGFLTGITSGQVTTALGFTPYDASNPNGYTANAGTVTSVTAGTGLSGGVITTSGTISLPNTGSAGTYSTVTTDAQGRVSAGTARNIASATGRSIVTTTSSTGFLVDASQDSLVSYDVDLSSTSTIGGASAVTVFLETADTNSTTPGDWTTIGKVSNGQTITLAIALQSVQTSTATLSKVVPAGKYVRLRSTISGTSSATIAYSQETKL